MLKVHSRELICQITRCIEDLGEEDVTKGGIARSHGLDVALCHMLLMCKKYFALRAGCWRDFASQPALLLREIE